MNSGTKVESEISNQSVHPTQQESEEEILADNDAVEYLEVNTTFFGSADLIGQPSCLRVRLRTESGEKARIVFRLAIVIGVPKRGIQAVLCHRHGYPQKYSKQHDLTCRGDSYSLRSKMENFQTGAQSVTREEAEDVSEISDGDEDEDVEQGVRG